MIHWLDHFPMPPSINRQHAVVRGRMIKTADARVYDRAVEQWISANKSKLNAISSTLQPLVKSGLGLRVDAYFIFEESRVLTKTTKAEAWVKVLDANNRLKSSLDGLSSGLGIDDKFIITGVCEKAICKSSGDQRVIFRIQTTPLRSLSDILSEMANSSPS